MTTAGCNAAAHLKILLQLDPQSPGRDQLRQKVSELELRQERGDMPVGAR